MLLRLVGRLAVHTSARPLLGTQVGSRKARTTLALLAVHRPRLVPVDRVVEVLWPEGAPRDPARNVASLVSRLRSRLGPRAVAGGGAGYRLGEGLDVDLDRAGQLLAEADSWAATGEPGYAVQAASTAIGLLDGVVLADEPDATWIAPARDRHVELLRRARHRAAESSLDNAEPRPALAAARAAVAADALDEVAYRILMRAYLACGEPARALAAYERLRQCLAEELGTDPAPETGDLHVLILRRQDG